MPLHFASPFLRRAAAAALLGVSFCALAASVRINSAEFGLFEAGAPGEVIFSPATVVPHRPGQRYGWVIDLATTQRSVLVREEYVQPARAPVVKPDKDESLLFPDARRRQVSERRLVPVEGKISGEWALGEGEPRGERHLVVVIEGAPETRFDYRVE